MCRSSFSTPLRSIADYTGQKAVFHKKHFAQIWAFTCMCQQQTWSGSTHSKCFGRKTGARDCSGFSTANIGPDSLHVDDPSTWKWPATPRRILKLWITATLKTTEGLNSKISSCLTGWVSLSLSLSTCEMGVIMVAAPTEWCSGSIQVIHEKHLAECRAQDMNSLNAINSDSRNSPDAWRVESRAGGEGRASRNAWPCFLWNSRTCCLQGGSR